MNTKEQYNELFKRSLIGCIVDDLKTKFLSGQLSDNEVENILSKDIPQRRKNGKDMTPGNGESMIGYIRLNNLEQIIQEVLDEHIDGDFIETGVWRGGACIFVAKMFDSLSSDKKVFVADSFAGLPAPDGRYEQDNGDEHHTIASLRVSLEEVKDNFKKYGCLTDNIKFLKGYFKDTLPLIDQEQKFSIIRLDGDMYASTMDALEALYPKLSVGGYTIIDDWCIKRARTAVEDYMSKNNINESIIKIDDSSVYWKKTK